MSSTSSSVNLTMPPFFGLSIASFAQSPSSVETKWAFAVTFSSTSPHSLIYQIVGPASDYSLDAPQSVTLKVGENGYRGKTPIGSVDSEMLTKLHKALASIPVVCGDPAWNSHNWVMEGILALHNVKGHQIDKCVTSEWVAERLGGK